jgi:hypothetical protein
MVPIGMLLGGLLRITFLLHGRRQNPIPLDIPRLQINIHLLFFIDGFELFLIKFLDVSIVAEEASELASREVCTKRVHVDWTALL